MITIDNLHDYFYYDDGRLYWKQSRNNVKVGDEVGSLQLRDGYRTTKMNGKRIGVHRIVFALFHGYFPEYVDHINGIPNDNRIANLRSASCSQNQHNAKLRKDSSSGIKNVTWHKQHKKWQVRITLNRKRTHIGLFDTIVEAEQAAVSARKKLHKEFANHG